MIKVLFVCHGKSRDRWTKLCTSGQNAANSAGTWFKGYTVRIRFRRLKKVSVRATSNDDEPCKNNLTVARTL